MKRNGILHVSFARNLFDSHSRSYRGTFSRGEACRQTHYGCITQEHSRAAGQEQLSTSKLIHVDRCAHGEYQIGDGQSNVEQGDFDWLGDAD